MKGLALLPFLFMSVLVFAQEGEWIKTEGEIIETTTHRGKRMKETGIVKFKLENGEEVSGSLDLIRIPFFGSLNAVGDRISINYKRDNPAIVQTSFGLFLFNYGMYILIFLGIIFSIKPFLKIRKKRLKA